MTERSVSLAQFIAEVPLCGEWEVSYTDGTHLKHGEYVSVGQMRIKPSLESGTEYPVSPFVWRGASNQTIRARLCQLWKGEGGKEQADRATDVVLDQLADSMVRTGLARPEICLLQQDAINTQFSEVMATLATRGYLVLVVDTGALRRGAVSFLQKALPTVLVSTVVPVFVMIEVQRMVGELNKTWRGRRGNPRPKDYRVLRMRPQVSTISRELGYLRHWRPFEVLNALPEQLSRTDGESRVDRLIIETVKNLKRERGLPDSVYLLTGDKDLASLATLERQETLHIGVPRLPEDSELVSVRYDSQNRRLMLTPAHYLLWDLAQVFSTIRVERSGDQKTYELSYYAGRDGFFSQDRMGVREE